MCGITAYRGPSSAASRARCALERLEYRGYDSAGIAARHLDGTTLHVRTLDGVASLTDAVHSDESGTDATTAAIGHTRWATHGEVSRRNAHPIEDCSGRLFVVHNGIIDNADLLRAHLVAGGHRFATDVDTEVIVHLVEQALRPGVGLGDALADAARHLEGSWAVVALDARTGALAGTAHGSPLIFAEGEEGVYFASDVGAITPVVEAFRVLDCAGMARVDVFLTPEGKVLVNEVNTLPGFTSISMYPKLWQASGLGYTELITRLIELAQERYALDSGLKTSIV